MSYYLLVPSLLLLNLIPSIYGSKTVNLFLTFFLVCFLILFNGFRFYSAADYDVYVNIFNLVPFLNEFSMDSVSYIHSEIGFKFLISIFKTYIYDYPPAFLFFVSVISIALKYVFYLSATRQVYFCILVYISLFYFNAEFIQVRMGLAIGICGIGLLLYFNNQIISFILVVLLASLIHSISIVLLLIILFDKIREHNLIRLVFALLFVSIFYSFLDFIVFVLNNVPDFYTYNVIVLNYIKNEAYSQKVNFYNLTPLRHIIIIGFIYYSKLNRVTLPIFDSRVIKAYLIGVLLSTTLMDVEIFYSRVQTLFDIIEPLVLVILIRNLKQIKRYVLLGCSFFYLILILKFILTSDNLYQYQTWL